jgi:hypothetical protein
MVHYDRKENFLVNFSVLATIKRLNFKIKKQFENLENLIH